MTVEVNISLTLNGTKHNLSLEEAKEIHAALGEIVGKKEQFNLSYDPGVRGGITKAVINEYTATSAPVSDGTARSLNVKATGVEDSTSKKVEDFEDIELPVFEDVTVQETPIQNELINKINGYESEIEQELETLKSKAREISKNIDNFQNK